MLYALILIAFQGTLTDTLWTEETEGYLITVSYPEIALQNESIGNRLEEYTMGQVTDFKQFYNDYLQDDPIPPHFDMEMNFIHEPSPDGMACIVVWLWSYTGGAHGNTMTQAFVFDLDTGETVGVVELLGGQDKFEAFVAEVIKTLKDDDFYDEAWVERGAAADPQNYHTVVPVPSEDGVIESYMVLFPPYQVDCYASGTVEVYIPAD